MLAGREFDFAGAFWHDPGVGGGEDEACGDGLVYTSLVEIRQRGYGQCVKVV